MSAGDAPLPVAELRRWERSVDAMRECDTAFGGSPDKATEAAAGAFSRAAQAQRGTA
jgi:hypothetical protein